MMKEEVAVPRVKKNDSRLLWLRWGFVLNVSAVLFGIK